MLINNKNISKGLALVSVIALLGFKDTGIFVEDFSAELNNGLVVEQEVNDRIEIIGEGEDGTTYKVANKKGTQFFVPKSDLLKITENLRGYLVAENTAITDQDGNIQRLLFVDEYLEIIEDRGTQVYVKASEDGVQGLVDKSKLREDADRCIIEGKIIEDLSVSNEDGHSLNLSAGQAVYVAWHMDDYYIILDENQNKFNVPTELIDIDPKNYELELAGQEVQIADANVSLGEKVVNRAKDHLGKPYKWGGTGPNGFDCSGLVYSVYGEYGVSLPRTSRAMGKHGTRVSLDNLQKGDLIFFNNGKGGPTTHVAMYIGDGKYIHASNSANAIKIDSTSGNYFKNNCTHGQRVI